MSDVLLCQGNALQLPLKDASVHVCVCSPPYYSLRDYGTGTWQGGDAGCTHAPSAEALTRAYAQSSTLDSPATGSVSTLGTLKQGYRGRCPRCGATRVDQQLGLEDSPDAYIAAMVQVFREVKRVLHPMGTCWVNIGDAMRNKQLQGLPWRLALAMQQDGWILRSEVIWSKRNCMPESVQDRFVRSHEQVFLFAKQPHYFFDAMAVREPVEGDGRKTGPHLTGKAASAHAPTIRNNASWYASMYYDKQPGDVRAGRSVWSLSSEPTPYAHFATFPTALVRRCLLAGAPSQVCAACGAPWRRVVAGLSYAPAVVPIGVRNVDMSCGDKTRKLDGKSAAWREAAASRHTTGFAPTCAHNAGTQPCTILDPFAGSGTTGLVARELGHHAVLLDLSYPYLHDIARERLGLADLARWQGHGTPPPAEDYTALPLFATEDQR